jgi:hypothetical protein
MCELGAGTGLTGAMLARVFPENQIYLTDLPELIPLLERNTKDCDNATCGVLEWGKPVLNNENYDVIFAADVVAGIYDSQGLARTMFDLSNERSRIYLSYNDRMSGLMDSFVKNIDQYFASVLRVQPDSENKNPNVWIMVISGKRRFQ